MLQSVEPETGKPPSPEVLPPAGRKRTPMERTKLVLKALLQTALAFAILFGAFKGMNQLIATRPDVPKRPVQEKKLCG